MVNIVLVLFLGYFILMIILLEGWRRIFHQPAGTLLPTENLPFISVIIPVRNESENVEKIVSSITAQAYPENRFEILIVDDHSEDGTYEVLEKLSKKISQLNVVSLPEKSIGKKAAITEGVSQSNGEMIVTTDADCTMQSNWLQTIANAFQDDIHFLAGPVKLGGNNTFLNSLERIEFASLVGTGAATLALGLPTMCNGANLAFRKKTFEHVGGYADNEHIASGDDEFLLRKIYKLHPSGVKFNSASDAIVTANPASSLKEFLQQRIRWAGKWKSHGLGVSSFVAIFIFLFNCGLVALAPLNILGFITIQDIILLLGAKIVLEGLFLIRILNFFNSPFRPIAFIVLQIIYPLYAIFFGLTANFLQVKWKGRQIYPK